MKVKICGLNPLRDIDLCISLNVDFLGFIFYEKSPRNLNISDLKILENYNSKKSCFTAVTVDASNEMIKNLGTMNIQYIQLHGSETNSRINEIKSFTKLKVIKAIKIKNEDDINLYKQFENADYILFDTPGMEKSIKFPINLIKKIPKRDNFGIAGSISINTIDEISKFGLGLCDLSSKLESELGFKDHSKIIEFMKKMKSINEDSLV